MVHLHDTTADDADELNHYGLCAPTARPSRRWRRLPLDRGSQRRAGAAPCGDFDPPSIRIVKPTPGQQFIDKLDLSAAATDSGVGLARITFTYDGGNKVRNFGEPLVNDQPVSMAPWYGSGKLALGPHTVEVTALDKNGNTTTRPAGDQGHHAGRDAHADVKLRTKKVVLQEARVPDRRRALARVAAVGVTPSIGGRVGVEWQFRNKKGKWRKLSAACKRAAKPFTFTSQAQARGQVARAGRLPGPGALEEDGLASASPSP